jgi:hypothetical protein
MDSPDYVTFYEVDEKVLINSSPFRAIHFCPRIGEVVELPGEDVNSAGSFDVVGVHHSFVSDDSFPEPSPARCTSIRVDVKRRRAKKPSEMIGFQRTRVL